MIIVNKDAWNKLDKATQDPVMKQAALAERKGCNFQNMKMLEIKSFSRC